MFIKLKLHSMVDVITNSSTTIFTYSDGSVKPAKELINEFLKIMGSDFTADDMFDIFVMPNDWAIEIWADRLGEDDPEEKDRLPAQLVEALEGYDESVKAIIESICIQVSRGKIEQPTWLSEIYEVECGDWMKCGNNLYIVAKDEKYEELAKKLRDFLYSTDHEAAYNG